MADMHAYRRLALALSASFTVITAERRGRGISPRPYAPDHSIARDVEDLDAIMTATGATKLFGLSSGAVIALEAARTLPRVEQLTVYEPPFYRDGIDRDGIRRLNTEIERGQSGAALIDALVVAGTAPALIARSPRPSPCFRPCCPRGPVPAAGAGVIASRPPPGCSLRLPCRRRTRRPHPGTRGGPAQISAALLAFFTS